MGNRALYDYETYFKLIIDSAEYYIDEPVSWDKIQIVDLRDPQYFGINASFVSDKQQLVFGNDKRTNEGSRQIHKAYELIKKVYDTQGGDGAITLQFGSITNAGVETILYSGNINLNTYHNEDFEITVSVEKMNFEDLFRTRIGTDITASSTTNLDSQAIVPANTTLVKLRSKKENKTSESTVTDPMTADATSSRFISVQLDVTNEIISELEGNQGLPLGLSGIDPRDEDRYFFKIPENGHYEISCKVGFTFFVEFLGIGPVGTNFLVPRLMIVRAGTTIVYENMSAFTINGPTGTHSVIMTMNADFKRDYDLQINDQIYLDCSGVMEQPGTDYYYQVSNYTSDIKVFGQTVAPDSNAFMYRYFDLINYMLESATGQADSLISSVLSDGGRAYMYLTCNGYQIRNFDITNRPTIYNLQDIINDICAIFGLGYGFTTIAGKDYLVIEDIDYFYSNKQIQRIYNIFDYYEEHASDLTFNEWIFGYEKFPDSTSGTSNTLDEYNTFHDYLTAIKTYKAPLTKKSKTVSSGYLIETQRREQFRDAPSDSLADDDSMFIVAVMDDGTGGLQSEANEAFETVTGMLSPETAYNLRITPARIAFNWTKFSGIGLYLKDPAILIINTFAKNNYTLVSKLKSTDAFRKFEPSFPVDEGKDYSIEEYYGDQRTPLHRPDYSYFKSEMSFDDIKHLKDRLDGTAQSDEDRGWIVYNDNYNKLWKGYVYSLKYTPSTEVAEFQVGKIGPF